MVRFWQRKTIKTFGGTVLLTSLLFTGSLVGLRMLGVLQGLELSTYDRFVRLKPDEGIDERILVVGITEEDIQRRKEFPLHDGSLADLLVALEKYEPRVIALDIGRDIPQGPEEGRQRMIQVLADNDNIIAGCVLSTSTFPGVPAAPGVPDERIAFADVPQDIGGTVRRSILVSIPAPPPADSLVEKHLCNNPEPDFEIPSLSLLAASFYLEAEDLAIEQTETGELAVGSAVFPPLTERYGGYVGVGALDYQIMLNYRSAQDSVREVSLSDVLEGKVNPDWVRDRIVLVGYTSPLAKDLFLTPYLAAQKDIREMNGVVVHAQMTSQILATALDGRPLIWALPEIVEIILILGWGVAGGTIAFLTRRSWQFILAEGVLLAGCVGLHYGLFLQGGWLPVVPSVLAVGLSAVGTSFVVQASRRGYTQALYDQLRDQFSRNADPKAREKAKKVDYLEDLVRRARAVRQGAAVDDPASGDWADDDEPQPIVMNIENPEMLTMYEQIKTQVQKDLEQEQQAKEQQAWQKVQQVQSAKEQRMQAILSRARTLRGEGQGSDAHPVLEQPGVEAPPPATESSPSPSLEASSSPSAPEASSPTPVLEAPSPPPATKPDPIDGSPPPRPPEHYIDRF